MGRYFKTARTTHEDFIGDPNIELLTKLAESKVEVDALQKSVSHLDGFEAGDTYAGWATDMDNRVADLNSEGDNIARMFLSGDKDKAFKNLKILRDRAKKEYNSGDIGKMISDKAKWDAHQAQLKDELARANQSDKGFISQRIAEEEAIMREKTSKGYDPNFSWRGIGSYINVEKHLKDNIDVEAMKRSATYIGTKVKGFEINGKFVPISELKQSHGKLVDGTHLMTKDGKVQEAREITDTSLVPNGLKWSYDRVTHSEAGYMSALIKKAARRYVQNPGVLSMYKDDYEILQRRGRVWDAAKGEYETNTNQTLEEYISERAEKDASEFADQYAEVTDTSETIKTIYDQGAAVQSQIRSRERMERARIKAAATAKKEAVKAAAKKANGKKISKDGITYDGKNTFINKAFKLNKISNHVNSFFETYTEIDKNPEVFNKLSPSLKVEYAKKRYVAEKVMEKILNDPNYSEKNKKEIREEGLKAFVRQFNNENGEYEYISGLSVLEPSDKIWSIFKGELESISKTQDDINVNIISLPLENETILSNNLINRFNTYANSGTDYVTSEYNTNSKLKNIGSSVKFNDIINSLTDEVDLSSTKAGNFTEEAIKQGAISISADVTESGELEYIYEIKKGKHKGNVYRTKINNITQGDVIEIFSGTVGEDGDPQIEEMVTSLTVPGYIEIKSMSQEAEALGKSEGVPDGEYVMPYELPGLGGNVTITHSVKRDLDNPSEKMIKIKLVNTSTGKEEEFESGSIPGQISVDTYVSALYKENILTRKAKTLLNGNNKTEDIEQSEQSIKPFYEKVYDTEN